MTDTKESAHIYFDFAFAKEFYKLLHLTKGVRQSRGGYPTKPRFINIEELQCHMNGEDYPVTNGFSAYTPIAFSVVSKNSAKFLAWDIDKHAKVRARIIFEKLKKNGMAKASFQTNGSDEGRAKVITTLQHPLEQAMAISLVETIYEEACNDPLWPGGKDNVDRRPTRGAGGLLRVLGANTWRSGPLETIAHVDGNLITDLKTIRPYKHKKKPYKIEPPKLSPSVGELLQNGIRRETEHKDILSTCSFLAHEALKIYGDIAAKTYLERWIETIAIKSPEIMSTANPTSKSGLLKASQADYYLYGSNGNGGANAERKAQAANWHPIQFAFDQNGKTRLIRYKILGSLTAQVSGGVQRLYQVLDEYCRVKQIPRSSITIDSETIGNYLGADTRTARRYIAEAISCKVIELVDGGKLIAGVRKSNTYKLLSANEYSMLDYESYNIEKQKIVRLKKTPKTILVGGQSKQRSAKQFIPTTDFERKYQDCFKYIDPGDHEGIAFMTDIIKNSINRKRAS